jgi:NifU-like protein involved in Fe-S cluster formation
MSAAAAQSLYSREVLRLAMALPHDDRLDGPDGQATRRSAVCGSEMSVDLALSDRKIAAIAFRAKACALGQASAAILRDVAVNRTEAQIAALSEEVRAALQGQAEMPDAFGPLAYARDYPARHGAIMLPFDTLLAAMKGDQV